MQANQSVSIALYLAVDDCNKAIAFYTQHKEFDKVRAIEAERTLYYLMLKQIDQFLKT